MTIHEIRLIGATNTRTDFLDPLFRPLVSDEQNVGSTIGDVVTKLRIVSNKLDALRTFNRPPFTRYSLATS